MTADTRDMRAQGIGDINDLASMMKMLMDKTEESSKIHRSLQEQVVRLEGELEIKNRELKRKNRLAVLGEMATCVAHEIRNPLGTIQLYASRLGRSVTPEEARIVERISAAVSQLNSTVEDILSFAGEITPHPADTELNSLVEEAIEMVSARLKDKDIVVRSELVPSGARLHADPALLRRVVMNLLLNAAEASEKGAKVVVSTRSEGGLVHVSVTDEGTGIPSEMMEKLFTPFFTNKVGGTGLGLSIANRIVEAHGGKIEASNNDGKGATFKVTLPAVGGEAIKRKTDD